MHIGGTFAPPGTHLVLAHSLTTVGQNLGGSHPHGTAVVVVVLDGGSGYAVVVADDPTIGISSHSEQSIPGTQSVT